MKRILPLLAAFLLLAGTAQARSKIRQVTALIQNNDYKALGRLSPEIYDALPVRLQLLTDAITGSHYNELERSSKAIETLLNEHSAELDGALQSQLFMLLLNNLRMMGEYGQAAGIATMLRGAVAEDDDVSKNIFTDMTQWFSALAAYPKTSLSRPEGDITLPLYITTEHIRNALGEPTDFRTFYTDVEINGQTERFIFDTGCSQSSLVSEEFAAKHGIRTICDSVLVNGAAASAYARTGILDSMRVGPITVYHPTFLISPAIEAVDTLYKVHAVLGTDFMNLAGEVQLYPDEGKILIPDTPTPLPAAGRNLSLETSGQYALEMTCDNEPVTMLFDTGATTTSMGLRWFEKHRKRILKEGKKKEIGIGGFGGTTRGTGYEIPSLRFGLGGTDCTLFDIEVHQNLYSTLPPDLDGWLGADFILKFDRVTINFKEMFVTVRQAASAH